MRLARMLALGGLAAAGWRWLGRRKREETAVTEARMAEESHAAMRDPVDEAIAESFPASDPPSYGGSTASTEERRR